MNEQTPRDPQQPIDANDPTPQHPAAQPADAQPTAQHPIANPAADEATPRRGRGILKPILIGAGAAVAVLAVAGVGLTVADALDGSDDQTVSQPSVTAPAPTTPATGGPGGGDDHGGDDGGHGGDDDSSTAGPVAPGQPATAAGFADAIDTAVAAAGGQGATQVELERDGWKVDVLLADGTEVEVRVFADGRDPLVQQDDDDSSSDRLIDASRLSDIMDAAVAAAGGGTVEKIEAEDDDSHAYEVRVDLGGDRDVDVELGDDLSVISIDD